MLRQDGVFLDLPYRDCAAKRKKRAESLYFTRIVRDIFRCGRVVDSHKNLGVCIVENLPAKRAPQLRFQIRNGLRKGVNPCPGSACLIKQVFDAEVHQVACLIEIDRKRGTYLPAGSISSADEALDHGDQHTRNNMSCFSSQEASCLHNQYDLFVLFKPLDKLVALRPADDFTHVSCRQGCQGGPQG